MGEALNDICGSAGKEGIPSSPYDEEVRREGTGMATRRNLGCGGGSQVTDQTDKTAGLGALLMRDHGYEPYRIFGIHLSIVYALLYASTREATASRAHAE